MKKLLFILCAILASQDLSAQKSGYKEIIIGNTLNHIKALHIYKISPDSLEKNVWLIRGDSLRLFLMDIDRLAITVNKHDTIEQIIFFSKQKIFENYKDWLADLKFTINVVNGDVGKICSDDLNRPSSGYLVFAWSFTDTKTALFLTQPIIESSDTNFKGGYIFTWVEDKHNLADKKF